MTQNAVTANALRTLEVLTSDPFVGTGAGLRVLRANADRLIGLEITAVHAAGREVWLLADRRHLYRLDGEGAEIVASLPAHASGTSVIGHAGQIWVGGDDAGLWRLDSSGLAVVAPFLKAPTREAWSTPWGGPPSVLSMASYAEHLYVSVHVGGIIRTSDGGRSWSATLDLDDDVHQVAVDRSGGVWAATGRRGLGYSADRGDTWQYFTEGLHATYLLAVAVTADGVLVGASSGHAAGDGEIYRLDGHRFVRCDDGLPDDLGGAVHPRHLTALGDEAVVALPGGDVYASTDGGRRWILVAEGLPAVSEVTMGVAASPH